MFFENCHNFFFKNSLKDFKSLTLHCSTASLKRMKISKSSWLFFSAEHTLVWLVSREVCQHPANRHLSVRLLKGSFHLIVGMSQQCPPIWMPSKTHFAISRIRISEKMSCEESAIFFVNLTYIPHLDRSNKPFHSLQQMVQSFVGHRLSARLAPSLAGTLHYIVE